MSFDVYDDIVHKEKDEADDINGTASCYDCHITPQVLFCTNFDALYKVCVFVPIG